MVYTVWLKPITIFYCYPPAEARRQLMSNCKMLLFYFNCHPGFYRDGLLMYNVVGFSRNNKMWVYALAVGTHCCFACAAYHTAAEVG